MIGVILIFQAYASRTLACEQALCLGKKKSRETGFFTLSPFSQASGGHFLAAFIISPHTNTRQETRQ